MCPNNTLITTVQKFQLVHPGKLAENQLARSQNVLVTDELTSVKLFTEQVQSVSLLSGYYLYSGIYGVKHLFNGRMDGV